jgi:hypothetical protein
MVCTEKLANDEAPKTRLDPVYRDKMEQDVTLANRGPTLLRKIII